MKTRLISLSLIVVALVTSGCTGRGATPMQTPPTSTPAAGAPLLDVGGEAMTMADLEGLPEVEVEAEGTSYTGIRIVDVLEAAGAADASSIELVASDGYSAELAVADLDDQSILAFDDDGTMDAVLPGQSKGGWVKDTVTIAVNSSGDQDGAGEDEATDAALNVCGTLFTMADLEGMDEVEIEAEGASYSGVPILDLLSQAGHGEAESVSLIACDGYSADLAVADLDEDSILALDEHDTVDAVIPSLGKGSWVKETVEITCGAGQGDAAALTVAGQPFTMDDLKGMEQVEIDMEGTSYTGVRILDLLEAAEVPAESSINLVASDGYAANVSIDALTKDSILAYNDEGGVNTVLPSMDKGAWVKYVIEITSQAEESSSGPVPTVEPVEPGQGKVVVDSLNRDVTIPSEVERVASMRSGITEIICALGQKEKIAAVDEMVKAGGGYGGFITDVHPDLMDRTAPYAGRDINAEEMLRVAPDLVLHGGYGRIHQAEALMEQVPELPVVIAHFETIENYMDDIRIVAHCVGAEERAEELIDYLQGTLDFVQSRVEDVPQDEKVRVFYGGHDIYHAYTPETFEHAQIERAGGVNVADELSGWLPEVSPEQLLVWDPEVIVVLNGVDVDAILNDPKVAGVSAIENERVYALPEAGWDFSSPRALFCIEWLATKLYPERFADVDIEAEADAFYRAVFDAEYQGPPLADASQTMSTDVRTVSDMAGRRVQIPAEPERVVSVFPYITFSALTLGAEDVLVGVDSMAAQNGTLAQVYPAVHEIPDVGTVFNLNTESVLTTDPDVVLTVPWGQDPDEMEDTLDLPVVSVDMNEYRASTAFIARVLGGEAEQKAADLLDFYEENMSEIHDRISDVPAEERTKVYVAGGDGFLTAFGRESTWHYEVIDAGGIHVSEDLIGGGSHQVSAEQVLLWDPDVIILDQSCPDTVVDVMADDRWQSLNAIQEERIYRVPEGYLDTWGRPHVESVLSRMWLASLLYPDQADVDIVAEVQDFAATFYGVDLSDAEVSDMLNRE
jgi:iron complex transport system substrate-binding protein